MKKYNELEERIKEIESELKRLDDYEQMYNGDIDFEFKERIIELNEELKKLEEEELNLLEE